MLKIIGHIYTPVYLLFKPFTFFLPFLIVLLGLMSLMFPYFRQGGIWKTWNLLEKNTFINKVDAGPPLTFL